MYGLVNGSMVNTLMDQVPADDRPAYMALHNLALHPTDIMVQGGGLSPIGNYFPWRIPAGETDEFILLLSPDGNGQVVVTLLEQGIEISISNEQ